MTIFPAKVYLTIDHNKPPSLLKLNRVPEVKVDHHSSVGGTLIQLHKASNVPHQETGIELILFKPAANPPRTPVTDCHHDRAGFRDVRVEAVNAPAGLPSAAEYVRFERESFGALHQMMTTLSESERGDTWQEIEQGLAKYEGPDGFMGPCEMLVGAGTK